MELKPIRTEQDYRAALAMAERLFDLPDEPSPDSEEGAYFDALVTLIEGYERKRYPVDTPTPVEAIKFVMSQRDLTARDLEPFIGTRSRVYEVLAGKRPLTLAMIRRLSAGLGIDAGVLVGV